MELAWERWHVLWPDVEPLMREHHAEIGEAREFSPDTGAFGAMCEGGMLKTLVARDGKTIMGYIMWFISNALDSQRVRVATQGPWYVTPRARNTGLGLKLLRGSFGALREHGVASLYLHHWHHGAGPGLEAIFTRLGAKPVESVFSLSLGGV